MLLWLMLTAPVPADTGRSFMVQVAHGESLHVVMVGTGEPVVLIPGFFGSTFGFRKLVPLLSTVGYQVVIIEPLGTGWSGRPAGADYSFVPQADRIAAVMDSLHIRHAMIVGQGVGGATAFRLAYRHKDLVAALVSIEGGPTERVATPAFRHVAQFLPLIKFIGGIKLIRKVVHHELNASSGVPPWITDSIVISYTAGFAADLSGTVKSYHAMAGAKELEPLEPHLSEIVCPVRLLLGGAKHDGSVGPDELGELQRTLRNFAVDTVPGGGHYLQDEHPEAVMRMIEIARASAGMPPLRKAPD